MPSVFSLFTSLYSCIIHHQLSQSWNDISDNIMKEIAIVIAQNDYLSLP
jgi:hypothetical protein